jgi:hypothetical protein
MNPIAQGQTLYNAANQAAGGDYSGIAVAASGLLADLPSGQIRTALSELASVGEGAAAGAAVGSIIPGWGTAIGAVVGAIAGAIEGAVGGAPPVFANDPRSTAEKYVFPSDVPTSAYAVQPLEVVHPRTGTISAGGQAGAPHGLPFYQLFTDPYWNFSFAFGVTWFRPPNGTPNTKQAAWNLTQWWVGANMVSLAYAMNPKFTPPADWTQRINQARVLTGTLLGGDNIALQAFRLLSSWYGQTFSLADPNVQDNEIVSRNAFPPLVQWTRYHAGASLVEGNPPPGNPALVATLLGITRICPLDFLYYAIGVRWDKDSLQFVRDVPSNQTGVVFCADTNVIGLAELACMKGSDQNALHFQLGKLWMMDRGDKTDAILWPTSPSNPTARANTERLVGIISQKIRGTTKAPKHLPTPYRASKVVSTPYRANRIVPVLSSKIGRHSVSSAARSSPHHKSLLWWGIGAAVAGIYLLGRDKR